MSSCSLNIHYSTNTVTRHDMRHVLFTEEVDEELLEEEEEEGSGEVTDELVGGDVSNGGAETKTKTATTTDANQPISTGTEGGQSQGQEGEGVGKKEDKPLDTTKEAER